MNYRTSINEKHRRTTLDASLFYCRNRFQSEKFLFRGERINDNRAQDIGES